MSDSYKIIGHQTFRLDDEGQPELLANFAATITREVHYVDGINDRTELTISGTMPNEEDEERPIELTPVTIDAEDFPGLQWVMRAWGVRTVIRPGQGIKDDLRTAIQLNSRPSVETIYRSIGWHTIAGKPAYLHAGGAIMENGNRPDVRVSLPNELSRYNLTQPKGADPRDSVMATLALAGLADPNVMWPLLASTITPVYGPVDFGLHLSGRTGTFKSEVMSLLQSHYGPEMDARHLPGSWSSTANALEAQAFYAANAAFVVDDFVPGGSSWQVKAYQNVADKIFRSQGNQSGRARLTDTSRLQATMYPRGIVLSTGEDIPEGHSVRARMLILELAPGDITAERLTAAQQARHLYSGTIAALIQHLAGNPHSIYTEASKHRDRLLDIGHTRTPSMLGRLIATMEHFLAWAEEMALINSAQRKKWTKEATESIIAAGQKQPGYLESSDPVDLFLGALRHTLSAGLGHFRTMTGGIPIGAESFGWTAEKAAGELPVYKARGHTLGWLNQDEDELYLDITTGYTTVKKAAGNEISLSKQTMLKRLKDAGMLVRIDEARQRNSVRITADGHTRQVVALPLSQTLDQGEKK